MKKPTSIELEEYAEHIGFSSLDPQAFLDHYESNGWMVGRTRMKDWKAAVRTWKRNAPQYSRPKTQPISQRNVQINKLNERKARLMRMEQTPSVKRELESIRIQLHKL